MAEKSLSNFKWDSGANKSGRASKRLKWFFVIIFVLGLLFYGGGGWYFSSKLDTIALSGKARRNLQPNYSIPVIQTAKSTIGLKDVVNSPNELSEAGTWGLAWLGGFGQISKIVSIKDSKVTREFRLISGNAPKSGEDVSLQEEAFPQNPKVAFGITYRNVSYHGPLGNYPAWFIPGNKTTWAITVHGNAMTRLDGMNAVPVLHKLGLPTLMITYRNDEGAPQSKNDLLRYGQTEWLDLQSAVQYALSNGAQHIVLLGYSMGGSIVTSFLLHSSLSSKVSATVLDAPMLNFSTTVDYGASLMNIPLVGIKLPQSLTDAAKWIASLRYGVNWDKLNYLKNDSKLKSPILLFQGLNDKTVPASTSNQLAKDRPRLVKYVTTPGAGHLESWNFNSSRYDNNLSTFIAKHLT